MRKLMVLARTLDHLLIPLSSFRWLSFSCRPGISGSCERSKSKIHQQDASKWVYSRFVSLGHQKLSDLTTSEHASLFIVYFACPSILRDTSFRRLTHSPHSSCSMTRLYTDLLARRKKGRERERDHCLFGASEGDDEVRSAGLCEMYLVSALTSGCLPFIQSLSVSYCG